MTARRTWIDRVSDGLFNVSFDRMLRDLIMAYRKRKRMSARQFGTEALGDSAFIGHRLRRGGSVALKTADKVLEFMGEPPFGPWFRCEVEAYIAMTGCKAHLLGYYAVGDPSFVSRLRRGASPRLAETVFGGLGTAVAEAALEAAGLAREVPEIWVRILRFVRRMAEAAVRRDLPGMGWDEQSPLPAIGRKIEPLEPGEAVQRWLARYRALTTTQGDQT